MGSCSRSVPAALFGKLDANARQRLEEEFLLTISRLLDRVLGRVELGLLDRADVVELARRSVVHVPGTGDVRLTNDEVEWIADIAGGHPFVLHRAGLLAWMMKTKDLRQKCTRKDVEDELVRNLAPLVGMTVRRISSTTGALEAAAALAEREQGDDVPAAVAHALAGEGLVAPDRPGADGTIHCTIPSPAIRAALRHELAIHREQSLPPGQAPAVATQPPSTLATLDSDGRVRSVRINNAEYRLLERLLAAEPGSVTASEELQDVLGEGHQQLIQRLSVLRKKIRDELDLPNAIENVYGRGYCIVDASALRLRGA